jgi:hypothetical protein
LVILADCQLAGVVFGLAGARFRAEALERRLAGALRAAGLALAALLAGALRVVPVFFGAARLAAGFRVDDLRPTAFLALAVALTVALSASSIHLPDITRWAASATASAISEPSRVALDIMLLAALLALSAASMPASRIARRALGLAAIAAAAAVRPAASISRLIAALVILSIVEPLDADEGREEDADEPLADAAPEDFFPEDFVREDAAPAGLPEDLVVVLRFAIGFPPWSREKRHFRAETVPIPMRQT